MPAQQNTKHPTWGISRPIKIIGIITAVIVIAGIAAGELAQRHTTQQKQAAAAQRKAEEAADWPTKRVAMDRQNAIAARQREEEYRVSQHAATMAQIKDVATRFHDLSRVADAAPPYALASVIPQLQAIHRQTQQLRVTDCMTPGRAALATAFEEKISVYLATMQANAPAMQQHSANAQAALDRYSAVQSRCT